MDNLKETFAQINDVLSLNPKGLTVNELTEELGLNRNTVAKYLEIMLALGEVEMKQYGPAKVWFYSPGISLNDLMDYSTSMMAVLDEGLKVKAINSTFLAFLDLKEVDVLGADAAGVFAFLKDGVGPDGETGLDLDDIFSSSLGGVANELEMVELAGEGYGRGAGDEKREDADIVVLSMKVYPTVLGGKEKGLAIICEDISQTRLYEKALERSENLFHMVFQTANDGMVIIQDGKFRLLNDRAGQMLGVPPDKGVGRDVIDVITPEYRELVQNRLSDRFEGRGTADVYPIDIVAGDGSIRTIEISGSLIDYNGEPADLVIFRDITDLPRGKKD